MAGSKNKIFSKEEFELFIQEIDSELLRQGVPIHARPLKAVIDVAKKLHISLPLTTPFSKGPMPGNYNGSSLTEHIYKWFDDKYGDRLKLDFSLGYSLVLIRGDAWLLRIPLFYGIATIVCERDLSKQFETITVTEPGQPYKKLKINLLKHIENLPQGLSSQLTDDELKNLLGYFVFAQKFFNMASSFCKDNDLVVTAIEDFKASAKAGVGNGQNYGQSLWYSLQAAEKMLKYFIQKKGNKFPYSHKIEQLVEIANDLGLPSIDSRVIDEVQCEASVRYSQQNCPVSRIVSAHRSAVIIGSAVMHTLHEIKS